MSAVVSHPRRSSGELRRAFTLVELLAVIAIIAILSSIFLSALYQADAVSKVSRTKAMVQKFSNMLMARWDNYRNMRLPISADPVILVQGADPDGFRKRSALRRLLALREMQRMEFPDRYEDLTFTPTVLTQPDYQNTGGSTSKPVRPALWSAYRRKIMSAAVGKGMSFDSYVAGAAQRFESAEMLYLILTTGIDDTSVSTEHIRAGDSGDIDHDGMREFIDAWGNPIEFLRWAPGFVSPMQPFYNYPNAEPYSKIYASNPNVQSQDGSQILSRWVVKMDLILLSSKSSTNKLIVVEQGDPFNPMRVSTQLDGNGKVKKSWLPGDTGYEFGYYLAPLIFSRGRDGQRGIDMCAGTLNDDDHMVDEKIEFSPSSNCGYANAKLSDPYNRYSNSSNPNPVRLRGMSTGEGYEYDNVHNQFTADP